MDWYTLEGLQEIAHNQKRVICAWRPSRLDDLQDRYVWDKEGKREDFEGTSEWSTRVIIEKDGKATLFYPDGTIYLKEFEDPQISIKEKEPEIMELEMNGDRRKNPEKKKFRSMTLEEVKTLNYGDHPYVLLNNGKVGTCKVNGKVRLWKRDPNRIEIPCKYGMYECFTFTSHDIHRLLKEVE